MASQAPMVMFRFALWRWDAEQGAHAAPLVAPYCAIPRDYLSDTPLLRAMGFLVSQHGQLGAIPPPPHFWVFPPWRACEVNFKWRCDTPPRKGYLSDTCAIPYENKANGCHTPLCDTNSLSRKGIARYGGVSRTGPLRQHHSFGQPASRVNFAWNSAGH